MRMWMVDPENMCRQHLLGEHVETHMLAATIRLGKRLDGYVANNLIDTSQLQARHDALAAEMEARGYNHRSPLDYTDTLATGQVDVDASRRELLSRCGDCRRRTYGSPTERTA